jgi:hypothetical protein
LSRIYSVFCPSEFAVHGEDEEGNKDYTNYVFEDCKKCGPSACGYKFREKTSKRYIANAVIKGINQVFPKSWIGRRKSKFVIYDMSVSKIRVVFQTVEKI